MKFHNQLSLKIWAKLQPVVKELLEAAKEHGAIHIQDVEKAASFCVYGQLGILLAQAIGANERLIPAFLIKGVPSAFQQSIPAVSTAFLTSLVTGYGISALAAYGITGKLETILFYPAMAFSMAQHCRSMLRRNKI